MKTKQELLQMADELRYAELFEELEIIGVNSAAYHRLKNEFLLGKTGIEWNDRLKILINACFNNSKNTTMNNNTEPKNEEVPFSLFVKTVLLYVAGLGFSISILVFICEFACKVFQQVFYITLILPLLIVGFIVIKLGSKASLEYKNKNLKATFTGIAAFITFLLLIGTFRIDPPNCCENNTSQKIIQTDTTKTDDSSSHITYPENPKKIKANNYKGEMISGSAIVNGKPIANVIVKVEGTDFTTTTNKQGKFSFYYLPKQTDNSNTRLTISATYENEGEIYEGFDFSYVYTHNPINITLSKK